MFIVRIQLTKAKAEQYDPLHEALLARGFTHTIVADTGVVYRLPDATYRYEPKATNAQVLVLAQAALVEAMVKGRVLVVDARNTRWSGLDKEED